MRRSVLCSTIASYLRCRFVSLSALWADWHRMGRQRRASKSRGSSSRCGLIKNASVRRAARQFRLIIGLNEPRNNRTSEQALVFEATLDERIFLINPKYLAHDVTHFAEGAVSVHGIQQIRHNVLAVAAGRLEKFQTAGGLVAVAFAPEFVQPGDLASLTLRVHLKDRYLDRFVHNVVIDSDDYTLPRVDLALIAEGCVGDLSLEISTLYGSDDAAHILDLVEVRVGFLLALLGKRLEEIASAHRVHGIRNAGLVGDYLLRAQRQHGGLLARQR